MVRIKILCSFHLCCTIFVFPVRSICYKSHMGVYLHLQLKYADFRFTSNHFFQKGSKQFQYLQYWCKISKTYQKHGVRWQNYFAALSPCGFWGLTEGKKIIDPLTLIKHVVKDDWLGLLKTNISSLKAQISQPSF